MIGVFASDVNDLKKLLKKVTVVKTETFAEGKIIEALFNKEKILLVVTGYNKVNFGLISGYVLSHYDINGIIGLGNCGYLEDCNLKIGDIAIAENTVQYSVNSTAIGYPDTVIPGVGLGVFECCPHYIEIAEKACDKLNYKYKTAKIATAETFVANNYERKYIATEYDSQFIDMECGSSGEVAYLFKMPCVFVKGISNYANYCAPEDYEKYGDYANEKSNDVVYEMLKIMIKSNDMSCLVNLKKYKSLNRCEIEEVIQKSSFVNLGVSENNQPYVIPMCFEKDNCDENIINLYSPIDGKKMTCIKNNDKVVLLFNVDTEDGYESVIGVGTATIIDAPVDKMCNNDLVTIQIRVDKITGRRYCNCDR